MGSRILIFANFDIGLYKFRKDFLQELLKHGHEVYISLPQGDLVPRLVEMGCHFIETPVDRRGLNPVRDLGLFFQYRKLLKNLRPDMVITYTIKPNIYGGIACRLRKARYVMNITGLGTAFQREGLLKRLVVTLYRAACKKAHTVFFENKGNLQLFLKEHILLVEQAYCLNGAGVHLEEYSFTAYPEDKDHVRFLFIGRVMKEKGMDELFASMERLKQEFPHTELHLAGLFEEGYQDKIESLSETGVICFHGYQEDVKPFISACHCFVLPSYHEGMANTLLEAGAMGRPLITSRIHGCMEAVEEGENGMLVQPGDIDSLYGKMKDFLMLPWEDRAEYGRASRKRMEQLFDKKKVVGDTVKRLGL